MFLVGRDGNWMILMFFFRAHRMAENVGGPMFVLFCVLVLQFERFLPPELNRYKVNCVLLAADMGNSIKPGKHCLRCGGPTFLTSCNLLTGNRHTGKLICRSMIIRYMLLTEVVPVLIDRLGT